jgi:hypothetical protein
MCWKLIKWQNNAARSERSVQRILDGFGKSNDNISGSRTGAYPLGVDSFEEV